MSASTKIIKHLGPYKISEIDDDILGNIVCKQGIPVIIAEDVGGSTHYAVLAKSKDLRIACAGCFSRDMHIMDVSRCRKCSSFGKHWELKKGVRIARCNSSGGDTTSLADASKEVTIGVDSESSCSSAVNVLDKVSDETILELVKEREIQEKVLGQMTDDEVAVYCKENRKIDLLFDARPTRLIHELRRQHLKNSGEVYSDADAVGADIIIPPKVGVKGRTRKRKAEAAQENVKIIRYAPRAVTDMDVDSTDNFSNEFK